MVVLGSDRMAADLGNRMAEERTSLGEPIDVVSLSKWQGVAQKDEQFMKRSREFSIKEYFFGDAKRTLSPSTQSVSFDDVAIFRAPDGSSPEST